MLRQCQLTYYAHKLAVIAVATPGCLIGGEGGEETDFTIIIPSYMTPGSTY